MRQIPTALQSSLNPNDYNNVKANYAKKQFAEQNQHYIHHNAVLPPNMAGDGSPQRREWEPLNEAPLFKDPLAN